MPNDPAKPLNELLDGRTIVMLMTMIGDDHSSRPLTCIEVDGDRLTFLVDRTADWAEAIASGAVTAVHATVADEKENTYVALNATATVTQDRREIGRLWNPFAGVYFDGPDDPSIGVLHLDVADGEYWDGPSGRIGAAIGLLRAKVTGDPDQSGDRGEVATGQ